MIIHYRRILKWTFFIPPTRRDILITRYLHPELVRGFREGRQGEGGQGEGRQGEVSRRGDKMRGYGESLRLLVKIDFDA